MGRLALDGMLASKSAGCDILRKGSTNHRRFHSPGGFNAFFFSEQGKDDGKHMTSHMNSLSLFLSISLSLFLYVSSWGDLLITTSCTHELHSDDFTDELDIMHTAHIMHTARIGSQNH